MREYHRPEIPTTEKRPGGTTRTPPRTLVALPEAVTTERLKAERLAPHHEAATLLLHSDPLVMKEIGGLRDSQQTTAYMARNLEHWGHHGFGPWVLYEKSGREVIGRVILRWLEAAGVEAVEVGFALHTAHWDRGYATEAAQTCVDFARERLQLDSLVAVTSPENRASQRVLAKLGLSHERDLPFEGSTWKLFRTSFDRPISEF